MRNWYRVELPSRPASLLSLPPWERPWLSATRLGMWKACWASVHAKNPRYFSDGSGKAVYLTGSHTRNNKDMGPTRPS